MVKVSHPHRKQTSKTSKPLLTGFLWFEIFTKGLEFLSDYVISCNITYFSTPMQVSKIQQRHPVRVFIRLIPLPADLKELRSLDVLMLLSLHSLLYSI